MRESAYVYLFDSEPGLLSLLRLFLGGDHVGRQDLGRLFPERTIRWLIEVGLIEQQASSFHCPFLLFPVEDLWIITDPFGDLFSDKESDAVFELIWEQDLLADILFRNPCEAALDLCCGSGVFALLASRYSQFVQAVDVNPRAAAFARFNVILNGVTNVAVSEGDLYSVVPNRKFDHIIANPPYNPNCAGKVARASVHAGTGGEDLLIRILAGLPQFLSPGGRAQIIGRFFYSDRDSYTSRLRNFLPLDRYDTLLLEKYPREIFTLSNMGATSWSVGAAGMAALLDYYLEQGIQYESSGVLNLRGVASGGGYRSIRTDLLNDRESRRLVKQHLAGVTAELQAVAPA